MAILEMMFVRVLTITEKTANDLLIQDVSKTLTQVFKAFPILINVGENRILAIGDFVFNLGIGRYRNRTLRKCIDAEDWINSSYEIRKWVFAGGKKLKGLVIRREIEAELLLKDLKHLDELLALAAPFKR
ncbi:lysozyme [Candidatus Liberibacter solanacearum]|uniref:lysozyme n=1 Tax=Candidatus Liberibacter solanacearum TaxID=556287 RepID=UPI001FDF55E5|nr:lysozyme [Candidatus Liberibacter solanacearum]